MLTRIDLRGRDLTTRELLAVVPRADVNVTDALAVVEPIIEDVRTRGADALREYGARFDGVTPEHLRVPTEAITEALATLDDAVRAGLEEAIARVRRFHEATVPPPVSVEVAPAPRSRSAGSRWDG